MKRKFWRDIDLFLIFLFILFFPYKILGKGYRKKHTSFTRISCRNNFIYSCYNGSILIYYCFIMLLSGLGKQWNICILLYTHPSYVYKEKAILNISVRNRWVWLQVLGSLLGSSVYKIFQGNTTHIVKQQTNSTEIVYLTTLLPRNVVSTKLLLPFTKECHALIIKSGILLFLEGNSFGNIPSKLKTYVHHRIDNFFGLHIEKYTLPMKMESASQNKNFDPK